MRTIRPPKKSETLEVRLSHETKVAFMARCQAQRRTASDAVRSFIDAQLLDRPPRRPRAGSAGRMLAAGAAGALLGLGAAAPTFAHDADRGRAAFERIDRNHDRMLSYREFRDR